MTVHITFQGITHWITNPRYEFHPDCTPLPVGPERTETLSAGQAQQNVVSGAGIRRRGGIWIPKVRKRKFPAQ